MNKAHLVVSQNFVFQNRVFRGPQGRTYTPSAEGASVLWWSLTGLFAMQTKNVGADEKRSCCRPQHVVLPIKGFHRNPPQWVEGMPVFVSVLDRYPCPINLLRRRCANWTIPPVGVVFHPTGHATGEPCAARTWQPMAKRLPFLMMFFPLAKNPTP